ncbi:4394_t:CDS:2 [Cetraspora pellucida]|uniref:4394_t:CDS:1 n=1 Tax=Cetraspora pellucida TaxID=1433469 RepID=A0ACA9KGP4_9GLOM|nr:4394_t:CDS:2 [Cetraspora pellucida]
MIFWIEKIWKHRASLFVDPHSLLVLDSFCDHFTNMIKNRFEEKNTNIVIILVELTKKLQPLDVYINKSFKDEYHKCYLSWMGKEIKKLMPIGHIQRPTYNLVARLIKAA